MSIIPYLALVTSFFSLSLSLFAILYQQALKAIELSYEAYGRAIEAEYALADFRRQFKAIIGFDTGVPLQKDLEILSNFDTYCQRAKIAREGLGQICSQKSLITWWFLGQAKMLHLRGSVHTGLALSIADAKFACDHYPALRSIAAELEAAMLRAT